MSHATRILFYLVLAAVCYGVALYAGTGWALAAFLSAGAVAELMFWITFDPR